MRSAQGKNPYDALVGFSLPCDAKSAAGQTPAGGAFAFQPDKTGKLAPNSDATAAAASSARIGKRLVTAPVQAGPAPACLRSGEAATPERGRAQRRRVSRVRTARRTVS